MTISSISSPFLPATTAPNVPDTPVAVVSHDGPLAKRDVQAASPRSGLWARLSSAIQRNMPGRSLLDRELTSDGKPNPTSGFRFSMIKDRLIHLGVRMSLGTVRDSVSRHGGQVNFKFAQTKGTFLDEIMKHSETAGGVCESISAHWISSHAKGERLFDKLYTGGQKGQFQIDTLVSVKQLQMDGMKEDVDQSRVTHDWLKDRQLVPRMNKFGYPIPPALGETGAQGPARLVAAILDTQGDGSGYKKISLMGKMAAHTVAAHVDEQHGVTFFDPNFGEFHFPNKESFSNWFTESFWSGSKYNLEIGLGQKYEVQSFRRAEA
ncbi:YopT-type cysteine protease domain-containing protein [Parachitinimonas caeni]|uniref:YopT-type cysteine protease domain-containing protein n=1 Tax=Parachitinimonas caeni TaxID=3031301 RepID=A0ABT7DXL4_9NEIS|nr:YopT-type cysteine protease domain-containing protein [Parachitinimonas caeni]MDK2124724.1 YopT-type cysteine protease domain-containing protein [Parachitinimonas caeni]